MYQVSKIEPERHAELIHDLEVNLRRTDRIEVEEMNRLYPYQDFVTTICKDDYDSYIVIENDKAIAVFGISKEPTEGMYCIFFLGSDIFESDLTWQKRFIRLSNRIIAEWFETRDYLYNYIHVTNNRTRRWLESIGAEIHHDIKIGDMELFTIRKEDCTCVYPQ